MPTDSAIAAIERVRWWHLGGTSAHSRSHLLGPQLVLSVILLLVVVGFLAAGTVTAASVLLWIGVGFSIVAVLCALAVPWGRLAPEWGALLPLLDLGAIGLCRIALLPEGAPLSFFVMVVALWLVTILRWLGVVIATVATIVLISIPSVLLDNDDVTVVEVFRYALPPLAVLILSWLMLDLYERLVATSDRLRASMVEQRRQTVEIEKRARLIGAVGDSLSIGMLVLDVDGNDVMWNDAQLRIHAVVSPPDSEDKTEAGHLLFGADGRTPLPVDQRPVRRAVNGETFENMLMFAGEFGPNQLALSVSALHVLSEGGEHEATVVVFVNVTEAQAVMRERELFVATVSHELRTPLTSIIGYADLAVDDADEGSVVQSYLGVIERNARQLLTLVEDLLAQQQIRVGATKRHLEQSLISDLATEAVESLQPEAARRSQSLTVHANPTPPAMLERSRILQVLDNVITNAIKYTPDGGSIVVETGSAAGSVTFSVADNGPGLTEDEAARIFSPFFRTTSAEQSGTTGAGIGLGLCRSIIEAHGGHIAVDSAPDAGTTITASIPYDTTGEQHD